MISWLESKYFLRFCRIDILSFNYIQILIGDKTLRIWDAKKTYMPQVAIPAHNQEVLTVDWCKYDQVSCKIFVEF